MKNTGFIKCFFIILTLTSVHNLKAQCVSNEANVIDFEIDGVSYEIIKEKLNWVDAAACAVERGGLLVEINTVDEQTEVFNQLQNSGINTVLTTAPDGGGAAYVWTGGNDRSLEGTWLWDGDNDGQGTYFWQGAVNGTPVDNQFTYWGNEPDNYSNQDALGIALTDWPFGNAGQWNDIRDINKLYFVIEYPDISSSTSKQNPVNELHLYPNPASEFVHVAFPGVNKNRVIELFNDEGKLIQCYESFDNKLTISLDGISKGRYFLCYVQGNKTITKKLIVQ